MTENDLLALLRDAVETKGSQAKVSKMLGYSTAVISQVLGGVYPGAMDKFLIRVEEVFGTRTVVCPVLGDIPVSECVKERRTPFCNANPFRVRLYRTCMHCSFNGDVNDE